MRKNLGAYNKHKEDQLYANKRTGVDIQKKRQQGRDNKT